MMDIDPKCHELAEHFLVDEPIKEGLRAALTTVLAEWIQFHVELWLHGIECPLNGTREMDAEPQNVPGGCHE